MNGIIICEGKTDMSFIQYYMRDVYDWADKGKSGFDIDSRGFARDFKKQEDFLTITSAGGVGNIPRYFDKVLKKNLLDEAGENYTKIVIITDRDDEYSEENMTKKICAILDKNNIMICSAIKNNEWVEMRFFNRMGQQVFAKLLLLVIPFEEEGALETFLLNAISSEDDYDKEIITKSNAFVDTIDPELRYIKKRRKKTKTKFNVFFAIRTMEEEHKERQSLFQSVSWKNYEKLFHDLNKLEEL